MGLLGDLFGSIFSSMEESQSEADQWMARFYSLEQAAKEMIYKFGSDEKIAGAKVVEFNYYLTAFRRRAMNASRSEVEAAYRAIRNKHGIVAQKLINILEDV